MAEKKKKSIYSRKLKDVNKDGKKNFGDTWLGDMLGADGKAGIQKGRPGLKASLKGARREDGKADTTAKEAKKEGNTTLSRLLDKKGETPGGKSKLLDEKGKTPGGKSKLLNEKGKTPVGKSRLLNEKGKTPVGKSRLLNEKGETPGTATKKTTADKGTATKKIPARSETYTTFFNKNKNKYKKENGGYDHRRAMKDFNKLKSSSGMAKGGMAKKKSGYSVGGSVRPRTGHTDLRKGLFK